MMDKLQIIACFAGIVAGVHVLCQWSVPRRGYMRVMERMCMGIVLCWICGIVLSPWKIQIAQSPLSALAAGYWGLPGVALSTFVSLWP